MNKTEGYWRYLTLLWLKNFSSTRNLIADGRPGFALCERLMGPWWLCTALVEVNGNCWVFGTIGGKATICRLPKYRFRSLTSWNQDRGQLWSFFNSVSFHGVQYYICRKKSVFLLSSPSFTTCFFHKSWKQDY